MNTLAEAWRWYEAVGVQVWRMKRLAEKHWEELPWDGQFGKDDAFRLLDSQFVVEEAECADAPLQDLAILVMFSVFERQVRKHVHHEVETESVFLKHPALKHAADEILQQIDEGSFFRVLAPFKVAHADLVEQINQIRHYRNWVAHGKADDEDQLPMDPAKVRDRLQQFLDLLGLSSGLIP